MNIQEAAVALARVAHELWRTEMAKEGWRYGPTFDESKRLHDALVPFDELHPTDKRWTRTCLDEVAAELLAGVEYPRGDDREFVPEEMIVGMRVGCTEGDDEGTVQSWVVTPEGCLDTITVRWDDGEVTEACAEERVLRRVWNG